MYWLSLTLRWFHLVAAMTVVGGTIFMRFALAPAVTALADEPRKALLEKLRSRWAKLVAASVAFLLISGLINFFLFNSETKTEPWEQWQATYKSLYQLIFGAKFALAFLVFFIASALAGRGKMTEKFRQDAQWWLTVNLILALIIVALSGALRLTHTGPTLPKPIAVTSAPDNSTTPAPVTTPNG